MSASIVAFGAWSPSGVGEAAAGLGAPGEPARVVLAPDEALRARGLRSAVVGRVAGAIDDERRPAELLRRALEDCARGLDAAVPGWRARRVGLALGTSAGGMPAAERLFAMLARQDVPSPELARAATYFAVAEDAAHAVLGASIGPATIVLTACAASTLALGLATRWLERGACDVAIAGGFDALTPFVIAGFDALRATTPTTPKPFGVARDGLAIGEGACALALVLGAHPRAIAVVRGFGAAGEAVHLTAPDREGRGFARAAERALARSGVDAASVDLVSAHATSTPFNDAAESRGVAAVLGAERARVVPVHPLKAQLGHTMGAAGALETLAAGLALAHQVAPASVQCAPDPQAPALLLERAEARPLRAALKLSAAFGGATAALVLTPPDAGAPSPPPRGDAWVLDVARVDQMPALEELARLLPARADRLGRACPLSHLALMALSELAARHDLAGAGIVVGHAYATIDVNYNFYARVLERGPAAAEPHRFPYTTPQAVAGECSIAFGLTGPNVSVGSGLHGGVEALAIGAELVEAGDADRIVVVAADVPAPTVRAVAASCGWPAPAEGAVAVLLSRDGAPGARRVASHEVTLAAEPGPVIGVGHLGLLPLALGRPEAVESRSPQGRARVALTS